MQILVISDIHIGDPRFPSKEDKILILLKSIVYDILILNGDLIDGWFSNYKDEINKSVLISYIKSLDVPVIWIPGNHDSDVDYSTILPKAEIKKSHSIIENESRITFIHGHQAYAFKDISWWSKLSARLNGFMYKVTTIDFQKYINSMHFYKWYISNKRNKLLKLVQDTDIICMGHTHITATQSLGNKIVYDGGSTMVLGTYIMVDDGKVSINTI